MLLVRGVEALEGGQVREMDQAGHRIAERAAGLAEQGGGLAQRVADLILDGLAGAGLACQEHPVAHREAG